VKHFKIIVILLISLNLYSQEGIRPWEMKNANGKGYVMISGIDSVMYYDLLDTYIRDTLGYSRIDSIKCVSDTIRIYTNNGQFKMPFSCSGGGGGGGVADSLYIKTTSISDAVTTYKIMLDNGVTQDSIIIEDGHPQLTVTTLTLGDVTTYYIKQDGVTKGTIVVDNSPGGGAGIDSVRCVNDSLRIYSGASVFKTAIDCANDNEIQDLVPYVISGDTIGLIITKPNPLLQDTLLFDNGDFAEVPNLVALISGGDTIGVVLEFENPLLNDTILFESGLLEASLWSTMVLTDTITSTSSSTWAPVFAFQPGDNERIRIRAELLLYTETAGVGTRGRFSISGGVAGYESYTVRFLWPNGTDAIIAKNGGYSGTPWEVLPTAGEALTHQLGTVEIIAKTGSSPNPITISIQSETGAAVSALPGSIFEYKQY
jgi:hypothetical protein